MCPALKLKILWLIWMVECSPYMGDMPLSWLHTHVLDQCSADTTQTAHWRISDRRSSFIFYTCSPTLLLVCLTHIQPIPSLHPTDKIAFPTTISRLQRHKRSISVVKSCPLTPCQPDRQMKQSHTAWLKPRPRWKKNVDCVSPSLSLSEGMKIKKWVRCPPELPQDVWCAPAGAW